MNETNRLKQENLTRMQLEASEKFKLFKGFSNNNIFIK